MNEARTTSSAPLRVLLTGATGYVGGRLAPRLLRRGHRLVCLTRSARKLRERPWAGDPAVEVVEGDVGDPEALDRALRGVDVAYYFVHSMMASSGDWAERDDRVARGFAAAAERNRVGRIVYLGGLGETGDDLSEHLASRRRVESELASSSVPVTVLRAAMIIGSGSASFEILRYLTERLPIMVTPKWVSTQCQPIAIRDVLRYLETCIEVPETTGRTLDIGGEGVVDYRELLDLMAEARGLRRRMVVTVPLMTPRLSAWWIHLVTPLDRRIARPLTEGLRNRVVCRENLARKLMPGPLMTPREAIEAALGKLSEDDVETSWSDAGVIPGDPDWAGGKVFEDRREIAIDADPGEVWRAVCRVGGGHGWYAGDWLWRIRGRIDRLLGGPGLRRGRRCRVSVAYGDALDFWRVTEARPAERLDLLAEMKLPGQALLRFDIEAREGGGSRLVQTALFKPKGLFGLIYWYAVLPLHGWVFEGMLGGIRAAAEGLHAKART